MRAKHDMYSEQNQKTRPTGIGGSVGALHWGEPCSPYADRCGFGGQCIEQVCRCPTGFRLSVSGECQPDLAAAAAAAVMPTLVPPSSMTRSGDGDGDNDEASLSGGRLHSFKKQQPDCFTDSQCPTKAQCRYGRCVCATKLKMVNGRCELDLSVANPSEWCGGGEKCLGGSQCDTDSSVCRCAPQHDIVEGVCRRKGSTVWRAVGLSCVHGELCEGGSTCYEGVCSCPSSHRLMDDGYCAPRVDGAAVARFSSHPSPADTPSSSQIRAMSSPCDMHACRLPHCFCTSSGRAPPGRLAIAQTPQFVVLTFDDAVNERTLNDYRRLLDRAQMRWANPNGCPIKSTVFVSHEWTNYDGVQWLAEQGHELAANSITHASLTGKSAMRWYNEMDGVRRIMAKLAGVDPADVRGLRAPQLDLGGNSQFEMMSWTGFTWDNSMVARATANGEPFWPQTLDHSVAWSCEHAGCPNASYPAVWAIPLNEIHGTVEGRPVSASILRAAVDLGSTAEQIGDLLMANFRRHYHSNRAPFLLSLSHDFLHINGTENGVVAVERFLDDVLRYNDVWAVDVRTVIDWMREPRTAADMNEWSGVACTSPIVTNKTCAQPNRCHYETNALTQHKHQLITCSPCPTSFPWIDNV